MLISLDAYVVFMSNIIKKSWNDFNAQPKIVILNGLTSDDASVNILGLLVIVTLIVDRKRVITFLNSLATLGLATLYTNTFCCSFKCWFDAERKINKHNIRNLFYRFSKIFLSRKLAKQISKFIQWETFCWFDAGSNKNNAWNFYKFYCEGTFVRRYLFQKRSFE